MNRIQLRAETYIRRKNLKKLRKLLLKHPWLKSQQFNSLLLVAHAFNRGVIEFLLSHGVSPVWNDGTTLLMHAASMGDIALLKIAHRSGGEVNATNVFGETALGFAISYSNVACARELIAWGANKDSGNVEFVGGYAGEAGRLGLDDVEKDLANGD